MEAFSVLLAFVRGINRPHMNSPHKGQWRGALMFSLIYAWKKNGWINNREAGDLSHHRAHYDATVIMLMTSFKIRQEFKLDLFSSNNLA